MGPRWQASQQRGLERPQNTHMYSRGQTGSLLVDNIKDTLVLRLAWNKTLHSFERLLVAIRGHEMNRHFPSLKITVAKGRRSYTALFYIEDFSSIIPEARDEPTLMSLWYFSQIRNTPGLCSEIKAAFID